MGSLGWPELIIIVAVIVLLFGARKLPDLARSMGASAKEFRKGLEEGAAEDEDETTANLGPRWSSDRGAPEKREPPFAHRR